MFKNILVATDGSEMGARAVSLASDMSLAYGARLMVLHVLDPKGDGPDWMRHSGSQVVDPYGPNVNLAQKVLGYRKIAMEVAQGLVHSAQEAARRYGVAKVETMVETGKPAECILEAAEREHADVIVMGSHGYSDLKGLIVGSVSHKVAHDADCACIAIT